MDASEVGAGAVLLLSDDKDTEHPVCYFKKKYIKTILAIQHFDIYISSSSKPASAYTKHTYLVFMHKMKNKIEDY